MSRSAARNPCFRPLFTVHLAAMISERGECCSHHCSLSEFHFKDWDAVFPIHSPCLQMVFPPKVCAVMTRRLIGFGLKWHTTPLMAILSMCEHCGHPPPHLHSGLGNIVWILWAPTSTVDRGTLCEQYFAQSDFSLVGTWNILKWCQTRKLFKLFDKITFDWRSAYFWNRETNVTRQSHSNYERDLR